MHFGINRSNFIYWINKAIAAMLTPQYCGVYAERVKDAPAGPPLQV
jgi:hypothetical protein